MKFPVFLLTILGYTLVYWGCSRSASGEEAGRWLTAPGPWKLREVTVNGKPVFRDGEVIEQFGEVTFSRYMEVVEFLPDGTFRGSFKNDSRPFVFNWTAGEKEVVVSDTVPGSGKWKIPYHTLKQDSFEMNTETTAYDPPNMTRIRLRFGH